MGVKQVAAKVAQRLGIAGLAREAKTAEDHARVVAEIRREIAACEARLADFEKRRATALLDGADADALHRDILEAKEQAATLRMNLDVAQRRRDAAAAEEATANVEAAAARVRSAVAPRYERRLNDMFLALRAITATEAGIAEDEKALADHNYAMRAAGRPDLVVDPGELRDHIREGLFDRSTLPPEPVRMGPVDADLARQIRAYGNTLPEQKARTQLMGKHGVSEAMLAATETDEAFALRRQNHQARLAAAIQRDDPMRTAAEPAIEAIERVAFPQDAHSAARNRRRVDFMSARGPNGERVDAIKPIDGRGQPTVERVYMARAQEAARVKPSFDNAGT